MLTKTKVETFEILYLQLIVYWKLMMHVNMWAIGLLLENQIQIETKCKFVVLFLLRQKDTFVKKE